MLSFKNGNNNPTRNYFDKYYMPLVGITLTQPTLAHKFKTRLGFKQYDVIVTKEQSVVTKIMSSFGGKNIQRQYNVLN